METQTHVAIAYNCPACGAELMFNADKGKLCCEFCESEYTNDELRTDKADESSFKKQADSDSFCEHMNEYECPNCGAEVVADETTVAEICVYCHSPIVLKRKLSGQMKPDKIIPFKFSKEEAQNKFLNFVKNKRFLPREFKSKTHAEKIQGVYFPFWITDADTDAAFNATATKIRKWRAGNVEYTETSKFNIRRQGFIHFEDIVTNALAEEDKNMLEGVLPYPSEALEEFSMPYLAGFTAKKRTIERNALSNEVKQRMNTYATTLLRNTVNGYVTVNETSRSMRIRQSHWEYSLLPIWLLTYVTPRKTYKYAMNGFTGKIYGELPLSVKKLLIFCGSIFTAITATVGILGGVFL